MPGCEGVVWRAGSWCDGVVPGPHLTFPLTKEQVDTLFEALVARKHLHYKYVLQLLSRFMQTLDQTPAGNCIAVPVPAGTKCILVGDTHGQLEVCCLCDVSHVPNGVCSQLRRER